MVTLILTFLAAIAKVFMDKSAINVFNSPWWNKSTGWEYKWKMPLTPQTKKLWYYLWIWTPKNIERFPYSSTVLVFLTDGWHLSQFLFLGFIFFGVVLYEPLFSYDDFMVTVMVNYSILRVVFNTTFQTFYQFVVKPYSRIPLPS